MQFRLALYNLNARKQNGNASVSVLAVPVQPEEEPLKILNIANAAGMDEALEAAIPEEF